MLFSKCLEVSLLKEFQPQTFGGNVKVYHAHMSNLLWLALIKQLSTRALFGRFVFRCEFVHTVMMSHLLCFATQLKNTSKLSLQSTKNFKIYYTYFSTLICKNFDFGFGYLFALEPEGKKGQERTDFGAFSASMIVSWMQTLSGKRRRQNMQPNAQWTSFMVIYITFFTTKC